jgi:hypothetical protein
MRFEIVGKAVTYCKTETTQFFSLIFIGFLLMGCNDGAQHKKTRDSAMAIVQDSVMAMPAQIEDLSSQIDTLYLTEADMDAYFKHPDATKKAVFQFVFPDSIYTLTGIHFFTIGLWPSHSHD